MYQKETFYASDKSKKVKNIPTFNVLKHVLSILF